MTRATLFLPLVLFATCTLSGAHALPPLGLTQITPASNVSAGLEVIDGTAYLNVSSNLYGSGIPGGIWTVDSLGAKSFIDVVPSPSSTTHVVKSADGELYFAANFGTPLNNGDSKLFRLSDTTSPVVEWGSLAVGLNSNLQMFDYFGARFEVDGSIEFLGTPAGSLVVSLAGVTPKGYVLGNSVVPGTIGDSPAIWSPEGDFSFVFSAGIGQSIRDRLDGNGVNVGAFDGLLRYGPTYPLLTSSGTSWTFENVIVSHSEFTVISGIGSEFFGFFPCIDPAHPGRPVPLLDIFPQLATIDIDAINSAASVDGYLYLTIRGSDGLYLFGARDPSLVPEPAALVLLMMSAIPIAFRRV